MIFLLWLLLLIFLIVFGRFALSFKSPYTLTMIFGKKGSGKTTYLVKVAMQHLKKGWKVYSTEPIPGCYLISYNDIGFKHIEPHSLLLVDEVGMIWDPRNFKSLKPEVRDFFKLQRHYHIKVVLASQTFDVDKKIRDLCDRLILIQNMFGVFSYGKVISKHIVLNDSTADSPSSIAENLKFESLFWFWAGSRTLTYIPAWSPYFDSFDAPHLKDCSFELRDPLPMDVYKERRVYMFRWAFREVKYWFRFIYRRLFRKLFRFFFH